MDILDIIQNCPKKKRTPRYDVTEEYRKENSEVIIREIPEVKQQPRMPIWLREVVDEMDGHDERLLIEKKLTKTDINPKQNRLSIMVRQLLGPDDFLNEEEIRAVIGRKREDEKRIQGINVTFIESRTRRSELSLRNWEIGSSSSYVFAGNWRKVAATNGLKENGTVQIWFFRCKNRKPCFALVNLIAGTASSSSSSSSSSSAAVSKDNQGTSDAPEII